MTNKNVILKDGADLLFPKTKTEIVVNEKNESLDLILSKKADLVDGKIPSALLPSYVDDVIEVSAITDAVEPPFDYNDGDKYFNPLNQKIYTKVNDDWDAGVTPEKGVIYVALDTNKTYRWSGTALIEIASTDISSKQDQINTVGLLKGTGNGSISTASAGVDYAAAEHAHTVSDITGLNVSNSELNYLKGVTSSIQTQLNSKATTNSPALTGTPTAPTAAKGTNTTQVATTQYVQNEISSLKHITYETI